MHFHLFLSAILCSLLHIALTKSVHSATPTFLKRKTPSGDFVDRANEALYTLRATECTDALKSKHMGTIRLHPEGPIANGAIVSIAWSDIPLPVSDKDYIGIFCPLDSKGNSPLDYFYVPESESWYKGHGAYSTQLFNIRKNCEFRYYSRGSGNCTLAAKTLPVEFEQGHGAPLHGHIAIGNDASEMRVGWTSGSKDVPHVQYGLSPNNMVWKKLGHTKTYTADQLCSGPTSGWLDPGYQHEVLLTGLETNNKYYYRFGDSKHLSPVHNFTTALESGDPTPFSFITYGDHGVSSNGDQSADADMTVDNVLHEYSTYPNMSLVFHHGDLAYALGYEYVWDQWFTQVSKFATAMPYMIGLGNHEQDHTSGGDKDPSGAPGNGWHPDWGNFGGDSAGECGVPVVNRFHMPDNGNKVWWYSFDYGLVHFVMMSTEHNYTKGSLQYNWLENDLKFLDRKRTPWVVLGGHRPMYTTHYQPGDITTSEHMQELFEDLLFEYKVDLALWSHVHSYQRMCKMYKQRCRPDGTVHIVVGTAGRSLDPESFARKEWCVAKLIATGYGRVTVANQTHMQFEFLRNDDRKVHDRFWIVKE